VTNPRGSGAGFPTCQASNQPRTTPLDDAQRRACLGRARERFLKRVIGDAGVFHVRRTDTKIDVGYWLGKRRVWACVLEEELLLFARGRRTYVERIPLGELCSSRYNHVTGEIVLAPAATTRVKTLKMPPLAALEILAHLCGGDRRDGLA